MPRLTVFAKGNSDVADSLFTCSDASGRWDGLNEAFRESQSPWRVRLKHETFTRSDALLQAQGDVPQALRAMTFAWPYGPASQFGTGFFDEPADAYVLSIQPDVTTKLARHRETGHLFYPGSPRDLSDQQRAWLRAECDVSPLLTPEQSCANLKTIVERVRTRSQAPILIYNLSAVTPGDRMARYQGFDETLKTRIQRFNLALIALSTETGVFVVDVDRIAACAGADRVKLDHVRVNVDGSRLIGAEVMRLLQEAGSLG